MSEPNVKVSLFFSPEPTPLFTYYPLSLPAPWAISESGNIFPSVRTRVIGIHLESDPAGATFSGWRFSAERIQATEGPSRLNGTELKIVLVNPTTLVLDDDAVNVAGPIWYSLQVELNGIKYWDDPKIYNPPEG